jgi:hypothetical protein
VLCFDAGGSICSRAFDAFLSARHPMPSVSRIAQWCCLWQTTLAAMASCQGGTDEEPRPSGTASVSPCKLDDAYSGYMTPAARRQGTAVKASERERHATLESALIAGDEMPVTLECLEWAYTNEQLSIRISNFDGPCGAEWSGGTWLNAPGVVNIRLDSCTQARCGTCTYDTSAELTGRRADLLGPKSALAVTLTLGDCDGLPTSETQWQLPLSSQPTGISCKPATPGLTGFPSSDHFSETQRNLYAICDAARAPVAVECTERRSCVDGYCLEPCTLDSECPLEGALVCRDGACRLPQ